MVASLSLTRTLFVTVALTATLSLIATLLQGLGLEQYLEHLPGWPTLFYVSDNRVYFMHKSLVDWLRSEWSMTRQNGLNETAGHSTLGKFLLEKEVLEATDLLLIQSCAANSSEVNIYAASDYAAKYAVHHLCHMGSTENLEQALKHWPYLKQVFKANNGVKLVKAVTEGTSDPETLTLTLTVASRRVVEPWTKLIMMRG